MDGARFDRVVATLAGSRSRRGILAVVSGALVGAIGRGPLADGGVVVGRQRCRSHESEREIERIITRAAKKYRQSPRAMLRVARCESTLDPCAYNSSGPYYGLFQFLKGTFAGTKYGGRDIWDPEANALAAAWMWARGEKNQWACQ